MFSVLPRRPRRRRVLGRLTIARSLLAAALAITSAPRGALAQDDADPWPPAAPSAAALKNARALFVQAEHDEDAGRWQDALDKLRLVADIRRTAGVRYHIALCAEHVGRLADALEGFTAAAEQARAENARDVLRLVGPAIEALGPRVPRLTVRVRPGDAWAAVTIDGVALTAQQLGTPRPVNPGEHPIEATTPDGHTTRQTVSVRESDTTTVELTASAPEAAAHAPASPGPAVDGNESIARAGAEGHSRAPRSRAGAIATTATAVALGAFGVVAFFEAAARQEAGRRLCASTTGPPTACDPLKNTVRAWDWAAAGAWAGGAVAGGVAIVLWARPAAPSTAAHLVIEPGALNLEGTF